MKKIFFMLLIVSNLFMISCGVKPAVKELKKINDSTARYWIEFIKTNGINAIDSDGELLLIEAVKADNLSLAKACIKSGADVNIYVQYRPPAIIYALNNDNSEMLKLLIKNKAVIKDKDFDCIKRLALLQDEISDETIDVIFSAVEKNMVDYENSRGILNDAYYSSSNYHFNKHLFNKLYEKNYRPNGSDYRCLLRIWFYSDDKETQDICKKILLSCKNSDAAKIITPLFDDTDQPEEKRFEFLKFQVDNGADVFESKPGIEKAFRVFTGDNKKYVINLILENDIELSDGLGEDIILSFVIDNDLEGLESVVSSFKAKEISVSVTPRWFESACNTLYKKCSVEEFGKSIKEIERILGQSCKDTFIEEYWTSIEEKCGLPWFISHTSESYDVKDYEDSIKMFLKEIETLESFGFVLDKNGYRGESFKNIMDLARKF